MGNEKSEALFLYRLLPNTNHVDGEKLLNSLNKQTCPLTLNTFALAAAKKTNNAGLLGVTLEDQASIAQWMEFCSSHVGRCSSKADIDSVLQVVNSHLRSNTYMVGYKITLADLVLFAATYRIMKKLTFLEKERYIHFSRWYDQVQNFESVKKHTESVKFVRNRIYCDTDH